MAESSAQFFHKTELQRRCRVCACIIDVKKPSFCCQEDKNKLILHKLGIDVSTDQLGVHPCRFCLSCHTKAKQFADTINSSLVLYEWKGHTDSGCEVCCYFKEQRKGGRPRKERKNRGRPQENSILSIMNKMLHTALPSYKVSCPLSPSRFLPSSTVSLVDLQCSLCSNIVDQPVQTPCRKLACSVCIASLLRTCELDHFPCPSCKVLKIFVLVML